jgi:hypothetical protein
MSNNKNIAAQKASSLSSRSTNIEYKEVKNPTPSENFLDSYKASSSPQYGLANAFIIDVLPNFVPILMFIIFHVLQEIVLLEPKNHAKVSAPTYTAYCLTIVYGYFLLSDAYIRPQASVHAEEIKNDSTYREYMDYLLTLPVPDWLIPILKNFTTASTPRRPNLWFAASAAGFNHFTHFGRFFPVSIFTAIHDIAATTSSRSDPHVVRTEISNIVAISIANLTDSIDNVIYRIGHLFASQYEVQGQANPRHLANKLNQVFTSLFNPVLLRAMQMKQTFTEIDIHACHFDNPNYNPYLAFLSLSYSNVFELKTVLTSISSVMNGTVKCTSDLAKIFETYSGISIIRHGYSLYALPTWYSSLDNNEFTLTTKSRSASDATFAEYIHFKQPLSINNLTGSVHQPIGTIVTQNPADATSTAVPDIPNDGRLLVSNTRQGPGNTAALVPPPSSIRHYDSRFDFYPEVKVLDPSEVDTVSAYLATLSGLIIESDDLCSAHVAHPHPLARIEEDNAIFLGSAIPLSHTYLATSFYHRTAHTSPRVFVSAFPDLSALAQAAFSTLRNPYSTVIPENTLTTYHQGLDRLVYGLHRTNRVSVPSLLQTVFQYTVRSRRTAAHDPAKHEPAHTPRHNILCWSPYTYVSASYDPDWDQSSCTTALQDIHFITNLRTIFGTDTTLIRINHSSAAMPVA